MLKCKSIDFQNGCQEECCQNRYTELVDIITSPNFRVKDLCADLWRLDDAMFEAVNFDPPLDRPPDRLDDHQRKLLTQAIYNSDTISFNRIRQQLMVQAECIITEFEATTKMRIKCRALRDIADVEQHLAFDEEERAIWIDYITLCRDHELAELKEQVRDCRSLFYELADEDELLSGRESDVVSSEIVKLDRAFFVDPLMSAGGHVSARVTNR